MSENQELITILWNASQPLSISDELINKLNRMDSIIDRTENSWQRVGDAVSGINRQLDDMLAKMERAASIGIGVSGAGGGAAPIATGGGVPSVSAPGGPQAFYGTGGFQGWSTPQGPQVPANPTAIYGASGAFLGWSTAPPPPIFGGFTGGQGIPGTTGGALSGGFTGGQGIPFAAGNTVFGGGGGGGVPTAQAVANIQGASNATSIWNTHLFKHIGFVLEGIAIWEGFRTVVSIVQDLTRHVLELETASARLAAAGGGGQQAILAAGLAGAQYGIPTAESGRGAVIAQQLGVSPQMQDQGRQITQFFRQAGDPSANYKNILEELAQTQTRAAAAGAQNIQVMDTLATMFKISDRGVEQYFDSIQQGIAIYQQLGISAEQAGVMIESVAFKTETTSEQAATTLVRLAQIWQRPKQLEELQAFGVTGATPQQGIPQIAAEYKKLIDSGDTAKAAQFVRVLSEGLINPAQSIKDLPVALLAISSALDQGTVKAGAWGESFHKVLGTTQADIEDVKAAWDNLVQSFVAAEEASGGIKIIDQALQGLVTTLGNLSQVERYRSTGGGFGAYSGAMGAVSTLLSGAGPAGIIVSRQIEDAVLQLMPGYQQWLSQQGGKEKQGTFAPPGPGGALGGYALQPPAPPPFGPILRDVPATGAQYSAEYQKQLAGLMAIPGYKENAPKEETITIIDRFGHVVNQSVGNIDAANLATQALTKAFDEAAKKLDTFGGISSISSIPKGESFAQFSAQVRGIDANLKSGIPAQYQDQLQQKTFFFYDKATGHLASIQATSEAIQLASEDTSKTLKQVTGIFNVPAGGEVLVAFQALSAGFVPSNRKDLLGGGDASGPLKEAALKHDEAASHLMTAGQRLIMAAAALHINLQQQLSPDIAAQYARQVRLRTGALSPDIYQQYVQQGLRESSPDPALPAQRETRSSSPGSSITLNNQSTVVIDGRVVAAAVQQRLYRQVLGQRRTATGGGVAQTLVG